MSHEIRIVRRFAASVEDVYAAWIDPEWLAQWMLPMPECRTEVRLEPQVGGRFQIQMLANGRSYPHHGEYLRLVPGRLIEFTWISEATQGMRSIVCVELHALGADSTELTLTQRSLPSAHSAEQHQHGWSMALDQLSTQLGSR